MRKKDTHKIPSKPRIQEVVAKTRNEREQRMQRIEEEFWRGFKFLERYDKAISIFGSARSELEKENYEKAAKLAYMYAKDGYAVITGGGPGIMEAGNKGAADAGGRSVGINIMLDTEQRTNKFVIESEAFHYFFTRKVMLAFSSQAYFFFPGGFGTLDEFFEMTMLVQTRKITPIPIILVGRDFWEPIIKLIENIYKNYKTIDKEDMDIYKLVDTAEEAYEYANQFLVNN